jgi:hypothetical protein
MIVDTCSAGSLLHRERLDIAGPIREARLENVEALDTCQQPLVRAA